MFIAIALSFAAASGGMCRYGDADTCTRGCDAGDERSCVVLGSMYIEGVGVDRDSKRGDALFVKGCKKGNGDACNAHGVRLREQVLDGKLPTWDAALGFFEKACAADSAKGCNNAAAVILDGRVEGRAKSDGVAMLRKSCEIEGDGSATGCAEYGAALKTGKGVTKDLVLAAKWLGHACRLGATEACAQADELGEHIVMTPDALARIERSRCTAGDVRACAHAGIALLAKDATAAIEPLRAACLGEEAKACTALGSTRLFGTGGAAVDVDEATSALDKACNLDDAHACRLLADAMIVGHAIARDNERALQLYKKACGMGEEVACRHAGGMALANSIKRVGDDAAGTVLTKDCKTGDADACALLQGVGKPYATKAKSDVHACDAGSGKSCFEMGERAAKAKDVLGARDAYDRGCKMGFPKACAAAGALLFTVDKRAALDDYARGCTLGNPDGCDGAAKSARALGGDAVSRARPVLAQACTARVGGACEAKSRLE